MTATLIDVTDTAREAGIRWPVSITTAVHDDCVAWTADDTTRTGMPQDEAGRLWNVLWMASPTARTMSGNGATFVMHRVPRNLEPPRVVLRINVTIGDDRRPRLVISHAGLD